jgi:site-specific DNA-methyltransferase (adenine-specific)
MIEARKSAEYIRNTELLTFFGQPMRKGSFAAIEQSQLNPQRPALFYTHPHGEIWLGDAIAWLKSLESNSVDLVFADPPYNIKKAEWDTFESQQAYVNWSLLWIEQAARVLKPTGTLYICGFSEILADLKLPASKFFQGCRWLVWHYKNKANLSNDWGRSHESILHFRKSRDFTFNTDDVRTPYGNHTLKYPEHPQAETSQYGKGKEHLWQPNPKGAKPRDVLEIPTTCNGMHEKTPHPTQKPEELLRKVILASSNSSDVVIDPFLGSGTTAVVAEQLKRSWKGCDISTEYCQWAADRIELVDV